MEKKELTTSKKVKVNKKENNKYKKLYNSNICFYASKQVMKNYFN
jgi:hypothetical protein